MLRLSVGVVIAATVSLMPGLVDAQSYAPGPSPTVGDVKHQCTEEFPAPRSRTTIGIGESIQLWIDESSWNDPDIMYVGSGQTIVYDSIGDVTWTVTGGEGNVYPPMGTSTVLTADLASSDNTITVEVSVDDSPEGDDQPVKKNVAVDAKIPTGVQNLKVENLSLGAAGNVQIGASAKFTQQITPISVNFKAVQFRLTRPAKTITWPDGTMQTFAETTGGYSVGDLSLGNFFGTANNVVTINFSDGLYPKGRLNNGTAFVDFSYNRTEKNEFNSKDGWKEFANCTLDREYRGMQLDCRVGIDGTWSDRQGPYQ